MLCWSCTKVKGKRVCPARGGDTICSRCCGTKRRIEIRCPEDCPFLHGAHDPLWESSARKSEETQFITMFASTRREQLPLLSFLHHLLLQARKNLVSDLSDSETLEIVSTLSRTIETRSKGVIYEHQTESLQLQSAISWLGQVLSRRDEIANIPRASDTEVLAMLTAVAAAIKNHGEESPNARSYLDTAKRVFRQSLAQAPPIELPGEEKPSRLIVEP